MPLYDYACHDCKILDERLCSYEESKHQACPSCRKDMTKQMPLVAKTPNAWNDGWTDGLSGYAKFDRALGTTVYSESHKTKELEKRGWRRASDYGEDFITRHIDKSVEKEAKKDAYAKKYQQILEETGDAAKAVSETFTADACLSGELNATYGDD